MLGKYDVLYVFTFYYVLYLIATAVSDLVLLLFLLLHNQLPLWGQIKSY